MQGDGNRGAEERRVNGTNRHGLPMTTNKVAIAVGEGEEVSGVLCVPDGDVKKGVILAHGAGNDMNQPMIVFLAEKMAEAGYLTLRFNFLYQEQGKKAPDSQERLYHAWEGAYRFLREHPRCPTEHIVAAGKSMGGRIASQMVAEGRLPCSPTDLPRLPPPRSGQEGQTPRPAPLWDQNRHCSFSLEQGTRCVIWNYSAGSWRISRPHGIWKSSKAATTPSMCQNRWAAIPERSMAESLTRPWCGSASEIAGSPRRNTGTEVRDDEEMADSKTESS